MITIFFIIIIIITIITIIIIVNLCLPHSRSRDWTLAVRPRNQQPSTKNVLFSVPAGTMICLTFLINDKSRQYLIEEGLFWGRLH